MKTRMKCGMIFTKQKGVMTYYSTKKYILSTKADVETEFLSYLHTCRICAFFA